MHLSDLYRRPVVDPAQTQLYERFRPRVWEDMVGQPAAVAIARNCQPSDLETVTLDAKEPHDPAR